jgi:hypothetical protein
MVMVTNHILEQILYYSNVIARLIEAVNQISQEKKGFKCVQDPSDFRWELCPFIPQSSFHRIVVIFC